MPNGLQNDGFTDCKHCGAKCCRFFGIPADLAHDIGGEGVPLREYITHLDQEPWHYFRRRKGVNVIVVDGREEEGRFVVDTDTVRISEMNWRHRAYVIVHSTCTEVQADNSCRIYRDRPDMCKKFVARTAKQYLVPRGCIFDPGGLGEDFGI